MNHTPNSCLWRWLLACLSLTGSLWLHAQSGSDFSDELYLDGWNQVVGITYDANGLMYVWEKGGTVFIVDDSVRQANPLFDISDEVGSWGAHGMLGFTLDPEFLVNGRIYALYAVDRHHMLYAGTPSYSASANLINDATIGRITRYTVVNPGDPTNAYVDYNSRQVLVGATPDDGFPITANTHGVGSLLFGTDGTLLASCGDGAFPSGSDFGSQPETWYQQALADGILNDTTNCGAYRSQSLHSLSGKLLRIDPLTGEGISSNPYYESGNPTSVKSRVWALGLRQPFRMTLLPGTGGHYPEDGDPGVIIIGDVGSGNREELNVCNQPGQNFGWPLYEGMATMSSYYTQVEPNLAAPTPSGCSQAFYSYQDLLYDGTGTPTYPDPCQGGGQIGATAPLMVHQRPMMAYRSDPPQNRVGGTINEIGTPGFAGSYFTGSCVLSGFMYTGSDFPEQYQQSFFFADYANGWIKRLRFNASYEVDSVLDFIDIPGTIVGLFTSPVDGGLYYLNFENEIRKVRFVGDNNRRPTAVIEQDTSYTAASSLTVTFDGSNSTDAEAAPLSFSWNFGDGTTSNASNPAHVFTASGPDPETFDVVLTVTDTGGLSHTVHSMVWVNNTPPQILSTSLDGVDLYPMDEPLPLDLYAQVVDAEHPHDSLTFVWQGFLYHDTHNHPEPKDYADSSFFEITPIGCETYAVYWYVIEFTVSDPEGLTTKFVKEIHPNCDMPVAFADEGQYIRGQHVALSVLENDLIHDGVALGSLEIVTPPQHGIAVVDTLTGIIHYTHDASATAVDSFTYRIGDQDGTISEPGVVRLSQDASPTISLLTPVDGSQVEDNREVATYTLGGNIPSIQGIQFLANGAVIGYDSLLTGSYRLTDIPPGNYQLKASLVNLEGQPFDIPGTIDSAGVTYLALGSTFSHTLDVTIHAAEVVGSNAHLDFPFLFSLEAAELRHASTGGNMQDIEGRDMFFRLADGTILDHELEAYEPSTGTVVAWVRIPSLSPSSDTELELVYGSPSYTRNNSAPFAWAESYVGRWHMNPTMGAGFPEMLDGTQNNHDGSSLGGMSASNVVEGLAGDGVSFDGLDDYFDVGGYANVTDHFTLSAWVRSNQADAGVHGIVGNEGLGACCGNRAPSIMVRQTSRLRAGFSDGASFNFITSPYNVVDNSGTVWQYIALVYDGNALSILVDGVVRSTTTNFAGATPATTPVSHIGKMDENYFRGVIDEVSLSRVARSVDWTQTEYHNLTRPGDFFSTSVGAPPTSGQAVIELVASAALDYVTDVNGAVGTQSITVNNPGTATLYGLSLNLSGTGDFYATPATVDSLPAGQSISIDVSFDPSSAGVQVETLTASSTDSTVVSASLPVKGLGQDGPSSLQWIVDYHLGAGQLNIGDDDPQTTLVHSDPMMQQMVGHADAVEARHFRRANAAAPVTVEWWAAGPSGLDTVAVLGWTDPEEASTLVEVAATDSTGSLITNEFAPSVAAFGIGTRWPNSGNRMVYSDDTLNTFTDANPHHIRAYPLPGETATYLLAVESEGSSFTFQDLVFVLRNVEPTVVSAGNDSTPADSSGGGMTGGTVVYRVNAGGPFAANIDGGMDWEADTRWSPVSYLSSDPTGHRTRSAAKSGYLPSVDQTTTNVNIFQHDRWDRSGGDNIMYSFPVDNGEYEVRLYLAEREASYVAGDRVFSVSVEGQVPAEFMGIDLASEFGNLLGGVKSHTQMVMDGSLDLEWIRDAGSTPLVNGIEILAAGGHGHHHGEAEMTFSTREQRIFDQVGQVNTDYQVIIYNTGTDTLEHTDIVVAGDTSQFSCDPVHVHYVPEGDSIVITITYTPTQAGTVHAWLEVGPHDPSVPREIVDLYGYAYTGEPSLALLTNYWYGDGSVDVGDDDMATTVIHSDSLIRQASILGDEVEAQVFVAADTTQAIQISWQSLYSAGAVVDTAVLLSWYDWETPAQQQAAGWVNGIQSGMMLSPSGPNSFLPGGTVFGLTSRWPGINQREVATIDSLNAFSATGHQVRTYPLPNESNAYLMAFEARSDLHEYQDLVLILRNIMPTTIAPADSTPSADSLLAIYRLDAGGGGAPAIDGGIDWGGDTRWVPSPYLASDPAGHRAANATKTGYLPTVDQTTTNLSIFQYERWDRNGGDNITYAFPIATAGFYEVRMYLANGLSGYASPGLRSFDVAIEGSVPANMDDLDPTADFGHLTGGVLAHTVYVSDGSLDIELLRQLGNPSVNGIEILQLLGTASRQARPTVDPMDAGSPTLRVYPNPTSVGRQILVDIQVPHAQSIRYTLIDGQGRVLKQDSAQVPESGKVMKLHTQDLSQGVYLLQVSGSDWQETRRLIIR